MYREKPEDIKYQKDKSMWTSVVPFVRDSLRQGDNLRDAIVLFWGFLHFGGLLYYAIVWRELDLTQAILGSIAFTIPLACFTGIAIIFAVGAFCEIFIEPYKKLKQYHLERQNKSNE